MERGVCNLRLVSRFKTDPSVFAVATLVQLKKLATGTDPERKLAAKTELVRELFRRGYARGKIISLLRFIDYVIRLPESLAARYKTELAVIEEEKTMVFLSDIERDAMARGEKNGRKQGEAQLLSAQLTEKFGPLSADVRQRIERADAEQLLEWGKRFVSAGELADVFGEAKREEV